MCDPVSPTDRSRKSKYGSKRFINPKNRLLWRTWCSTNNAIGGDGQIIQEFVARQQVRFGAANSVLSRIRN